MRPLITFFLVLGAIFMAWLTLPEVFAQSDDPSEPLLVVTKDIEPFVFVNGDEVSGFSIDLLQALALAMGRTYRIEIVDSVSEQIDAVADGQADLAIAAISITEDREQRVDFSHRYYESGLGILTKSGGGLPLRETLGAAFSPSLLRLLALLLLSIIAAGHVIWLVERNRNPEFPTTYFRGVWEGIWWAAVTVTTVGYGDRTPLGRPGRLFGIFWMFAGLFIIANFTAGVTSQLTLQTLQGAINGPEDLRGKQVAAIEGTTGAEWLASQGIGHRAVATIEEAYALLDSDQVQAVVYDHPVLLYYALQNESGSYIVPGGPFNKEDYGIAMPEGSPLREEVNRALLSVFEDGTYERLRAKWYGDAAE